MCSSTDRLVSPCNGKNPTAVFVSGRAGTGYKETQWLGMYGQSETRAGKHRRHKRTINVSSPTQANNATRATNSNLPARPLYMNVTSTPKKFVGVLTRGIGQRFVEGMDVPVLE